MSIHLEQYKAFAFYNQSFNKRLYELVHSMNDSERKSDRGAFFGSIHKTFNHILLADLIWLARFRQAGIASTALEGANLIESFNRLDEELYTDFNALHHARTETDEVIIRWAAQLTEHDLAAKMNYKNSKGIERNHSTWLAISHFFNHQTHHRGQVTTLLFQAGIDPGVTDFLMIVERNYFNQ